MQDSLCRDMLTNLQAQFIESFDKSINVMDEFNITMDLLTDTELVDFMECLERQNIIDNIFHNIILEM